MQKSRALIFFLVSMLLSTLSASAEVTLVRRLPESGSNQAEAEWKKPMGPDIRTTTETAVPAARLSGRLIVGGSGSGTNETASIEDWSTDSLLNYRDYVGANGVVDIGAQAFRDTGIDSFSQHYSGDLAYSTPDFSLTLSGNYDQSETLTIEGQSVSSTSGLGLAISTSDNVRYPFQLEYASSWDDQEYSDSQSELEDRQEADYSLELSSQLPFGPVLFDVEGLVDIHHDRLDDVSSRGYGGTLAATIPLSEVIGLYAGLEPQYSETEYQITENGTREQSLGSDAGVLFTFSEQFEGELHARRRDAWRSDPTFATDDLSHTSVWSGTTKWSLIAPEELTTTAEYSLSREAGGSISQDLAGESTWKQDEGLLRKAGAKSRFILSNPEASTSSAEERQSLQISSFLLLMPMDEMKIDSAYSVNRAEQLDEDILMQHDVSVDLSHAPVEGLSYGLGGAYGYVDESAQTVSTYSGNSRLNLQPIFGYRRLDLSLSELFELEDEIAGQNLLSKSTFSSAVPLSKQFSLRYLFSWEWVELASETAEDGSAYQHSAGFTLAGQGIPFSVNSSYLVGHGFRGVQHQVDARLDVPLMESFSVISKFSYRYAETVDYETPFLFSTFAHYEF